MRTSCKKIFTIGVMALMLVNYAYARNHLIFSVAEEIPMGYDNEVLKRNYYVNIGSNQGVTPGTLLDVYRVISKSNPYDNKKRINYRVPIGQLEIAHSENESAIGYVKKINDEIHDPLFEINSFMIGDHVEVHIK